jgi:hypothetical protein
MPPSQQDVLLQLALAVHDLGTAITALQVRLTQVIADSEKQAILLALPRLKTDQRDLEATLAAMAASGKPFEPPSDKDFEALETAADQLSAATARREIASTVIDAAAAVVTAVRGVAGSAPA